MAWRLFGAKPLSKPKLTRFTDIYAALGGDELIGILIVKMVVRPSYLYNVNSHSGNKVCLYWNRPQNICQYCEWSYHYRYSFHYSAYSNTCMVWQTCPAIELQQQKFRYRWCKCITLISFVPNYFEENKYLYPFDISLKSLLNSLRQSDAYMHQ